MRRSVGILAVLASVAVAAACGTATEKPAQPAAEPTPPSGGTLRAGLIDELWGETPPATAAKALHGLVSQLRRALDSGEVLVTRAPGYVLRLEPGSLDTERFESLLAEGRRALEEGEPESAARLLREGLALWRGAPLAEFAFDAFAQAEIRRLAERRLEALEERVEADLALGEHARVIGELEELVTAHPLRERLRGQLMLALYRTGRQPEALDVYREARRVQVHELGIEPGQALQRLEKAILTQDPALEPPPPRPPTRPPAAPPAPGPELPVPGRRRRAALIAVGVLAVAALAAVVPILLVGGDEPLVVVPDSLVRIDPEIAEVVPVGRRPIEIAVARPFVFVVNVDDDTVSRLDTRSGDVETFSSAQDPIGLLAQDERTIWVGSNTTPEVVRVDAETLGVERRITLRGRGAVWLATGGGSLWVTEAPAGAPTRSFEPEPISRVSLATGEVEATYETGLFPVSVAFGEGAAWVLNYGDSTVTRIDPGDGSISQFNVGHQAVDVTVGFGSVWILKRT